MPFRESHHVTCSLVAKAEKQSCDLPDLSLDDMQAINTQITEDVFNFLSVQNSVASRKSYGGTSPEQVRLQVARWKEVLL